ncbi:MAG: hypothetical protein KF902_10485 [Phycisphaeraceae bacterium]|nr:hypothetical protein [Phycisphaeraceae bacterium]
MSQTTPSNPTLPPPVDDQAARSDAAHGGDGQLAPVAAVPCAVPVETVAVRRKKRTLAERIEAYVSRLSAKNNFWHRVTSLIWLPYAFRSGIKMKRIDGKTFEAVLPFRRFNRNWYNAMAGAALLGNAEIAGGMYVFGICGGDYTVVCKHLEYKFLRPCFGPARYLITPHEVVEELVRRGGEFNITITMDVHQQLNKPGEKPKRVGRAIATFHVTPKLHHKQKKAARAGK